MSRKSFSPAAITFGRLTATYSSEAIASRSTSSGDWASTSDVSYRPAWHSPSRNSSVRRLPARGASGRGTDPDLVHGELVDRPVQRLHMLRLEVVVDEHDKREALSRERAQTSVTIARSVSSATWIASAKPTVYRVTAYASVGRISTATSGSSRRRPTCSATPIEMIGSVASGACGPCGSVEPTGQRMTGLRGAGTEVADLDIGQIREVRRSRHGASLAQAARAMSALDARSLVARHAASGRRPRRRARRARPDRRGLRPRRRPLQGSGARTRAGRPRRAWHAPPGRRRGRW